MLKSVYALRSADHTNSAQYDLAMAGSFYGAWVFEVSGRRQAKESFHLAFRTGFGQLLGCGTKIMLGGLIWFIVTVAAFLP